MTKIFNYYLSEGYDIQMDTNGGLPNLKISKNGKSIRCIFDKKCITNSDALRNVFEALTGILNDPQGFEERAIL